jgi:hypothetical protein
VSAGTAGRTSPAGEEAYPTVDAYEGAATTLTHEQGKVAALRELLDRTASESPVGEDAMITVAEVRRVLGVDGDGPARRRPARRSERKS